jgi:NAD(P)H dehydrogenase (quinone)
MFMKYLIIYTHPNPKSFCHAVKEEIVAKLKDQGSEVEVRDLYQMGFNPVLSSNDFMQFIQKKTLADIQKEQECVRQADTIIFIYPVWWFSMPAMLKGYIDRVFIRGFAYDMKGHMIQGLLKGKKVMLFSTTGGPSFAYYLLGYLVAMKTAIDAGIFNFCGLKVALHKYFYAVPTISDGDRKKMLASIKNIHF